MHKALLRLSLGFTMIVAASTVLLLTDQPRPRSQATSAHLAKLPTVALFQHLSQPAIDSGAQGVIAGLVASGFRDGETVRIRRFNAEGDAATANTIARELVGGDYALIVTLSTPSLQAVAGANREAKVPHVFGLVSDPVAAGVGIARDDPEQHPPYMTGLGTMQPVADAFRMARRFNPGLSRVGVAWNPSEANSEACTKIARATSKDLGITLLEANVENSAAVSEAVASVIGRGAEAVWIGGDITVLSTVESVIGSARKAGVPVFSNFPGTATKGALFDLGADYEAVGLRVGQLAAAVLGGKSPETMPILYEVPPELWINRVALGSLQPGWSIPSADEATADVLVERDGLVRRKRREPAAVAAKPAAPRRLSKIGLVTYVDATVVEEAREGIREGLEQAGLVNGRDFRLDYRSAQGDVATLNAIYDELNGNDTDVILCLTTTGLQSGLRKVDRKPLLFAVVLDPIAAGAGKSNTDHRPNVTGVYLDFPYAEVVRTIREILPDARRAGSLFAPGEVNSVVSRDRFAHELSAQGLELVSLPVNSATDVSDAAQNLCQSRIDLVCQISDALSNGSFPAIARACETTKTPLFSFASGQAKNGAILTVGSNYIENGRAAGLLTAEVIRGADVSRIPFRSTSVARRSVNLETARYYGVTIPPGWLAKADEVLRARGK